MDCKRYIYFYSDGIFQFASGDRGYLDENRFLYIEGRIKETISLKNAKKINSTVVEELLDHCESIQEIAARGVENDIGYDDLHIFIRSR